MHSLESLFAAEALSPAPVVLGRRVQHHLVEDLGVAEAVARRLPSQPSHEALMDDHLLFLFPFIALARTLLEAGFVVPFGCFLGKNSCLYIFVSDGIKNYLIRYYV